MQVMKLLMGVLAIAAFLGAAVAQAVGFQRRAPNVGTRGAGFDLIFLPTPEQARRLSLGFTSLLSDYYWVRALQYFSEPSNARTHYKNLPDFLDLIVGIDPDFEYVYKFAGIAVPFDIGRFRFKNTDRSTQLLEKGVARFPKNWQLQFFLGYNYLNFSNRPIEAAEHFAIAGKIDGAPPYLSAFAAKIFALRGELDRATAFAEETLNATQDPEIRQMMEIRLEDLKVERELRRIESAAAQFKEARGRWPATIAELVAYGFEPSPLGFALDESGVASNQGRRRLELYQLPAWSEYGAAPP